MNISKQTIDEVMQMPDHFFGRRWPVGLFAGGVGAGTYYDISELALPERCVLWEVIWWNTSEWVPGDSFRLALGDQLPANVGMMNNLEPLLRDVGIPGPEPRFITCTAFSVSSRLRMRKPIISSGRRVVLECSAGVSGIKSIQVVLIFSTIPRTIPDWLVSPSYLDIDLVRKLLAKGDKQW